MDNGLQLLKRIERDPRPVFAVAQDYGDGQRVATHRHSVCQLLHAVSGVMIARIANRVWMVPPGRAIWIPANIEHSFRMRGAVQVRALFVRSSLCPALDREGSVVRVSALAKELILRLLDTGKNASATPARRLMLSLLMLELAPSAQMHPEIRLPLDARARSVANFILANPGDRTQFAALAKRHGIGVKSLSRRFVEGTGLAPDTWRRLARLHEAAARLRTGQSVARVAFDLGYETLSGFCHAYRACFGETPGSTRRQVTAQ
jgi:AraC-like DNA-binding protein/mannose-6-phosphate isomerase-like protein (cupin superfamily)